MSTQQADPTVTERVSMVWPAELKAKVRRLVGARGLTDFTLDAVRDKLGRLEDRRQMTAPLDEPDAPVAGGTIGHAQQVRDRDGRLDPAVVAGLPLAERMNYARELIEQRESAAGEGAPSGRCSKCKEELVNGECWSCPPGA